MKTVDFASCTGASVGQNLLQPFCLLCLLLKGHARTGHLTKDTDLPYSGRSKVMDSRPSSMGFSPTQILNSCCQCQTSGRAQPFTALYYQVFLTKNPTQEQSWKARAIPDSDSSAFLGLGAGEGDSLFSVLLCLGATRQNEIAQLQFMPFLHTLLPLQTVHTIFEGTKVQNGT